ncbi:MAG: GNAT family N-acetyltransferase [Verrucomicrobiota bacterium]
MPSSSPNAIAISRYRPEDATACLALFEGNADPYFAAEERALFARFLDNPQWTADYFVVRHEGDIVACGGWMADTDGVLELSWGMVSRTRHGTGLGTTLLLYRLEQLAAEHAGATVRVRTSQHTAGFFARFGFRETARQTDGFGPGLDTVTLVRRVGGSLHRSGAPRRDEPRGKPAE